ncbi:putative mannosyltransferase MNT3 [Candida viswanathii]|uniref:Putative mannosyltransferase MNT3 n=1 Tax=Candida viswanathii TaxID=5486 RepID=A0A367XZV3_9ASCO|nr:putative mannosyltransferase MNT3 [Candida viswanathii]
MLRHSLILLFAAILFVFPLNLVHFASSSLSEDAPLSTSSSRCYQYVNDAELKQYLNENPHTLNFCIEKSQVVTARENATMLMLCRNFEVYSVRETLQNIQDRFNNKFNYDYTFLNNEPFTSEFIYLVSTLVSGGRLNFGLIPQSHWSYPPHINVTQVDIVRQLPIDVPYWSSESYRHMCRYYSGFFYKHEYVRQYRYYWRIEPGIKIYCDIADDVFRLMRQQDKKYGFVISLFEYSETIPGLWHAVRDYVESRGLRERELLPMLLNEKNWYNLCHFWSNFEIASLDVFDNPQYEDLFGFLDERGGFYYERWGDAPVHSIGVALFLKKLEIHFFENVGYYHMPYLQCPQDTTMYVENRCTCDPDNDFTWTDLSCTSHFLKVLAS